MKVQLKKLVGRKWECVTAEELVGKSICDFMLKTDVRCVCAMTVKGEDKPSVFFANKTSEVESYIERGYKTFHARDVKDFLGEPNPAGLVAGVFPGGEFFSMEKIEEERPLF